MQAPCECRTCGRPLTAEERADPITEEDCAACVVADENRHGDWFNEYDHRDY